MAVDRELDQNKRNERIVEPHDYGVQNGIVRLFCWQVGGRSGGRVPGWRMIDVAGMQNCELLEAFCRKSRDCFGPASSVGRDFYLRSTAGEVEVNG
ncbi:MAG: hypothetical protein ABSF97_13495 [Candidatus Sulfotelmatobacter sp.]|jgi:hypothetical protein